MVPWKRSITIALSAKNKLGLVNGTLPRPDTEPLKAQWDRVNDMVISWILNTVSDEISTGMDFVSYAQEIWIELHDQFASIDGHRVYQVLKDLHALEQSEKSVEFYYHKMKNLWDEYSALEPTIVCKCESHKLQEEREQRKKLLQFLMGLNESFAAARGQILMMNPLPSVPQAFSLIKQEERQRQGYIISSSFIANASAKKFTHQQPNASTDGSSLEGNNVKKQGLKCNYCHKEGHLKETCYKLVGYPLKEEAEEDFLKIHLVFDHILGLSMLQMSKKAILFLALAQTLVQPATSSFGLDNQHFSQQSFDKLQQQVAQMSQLMTSMMNNKSLCSTPEDHIAGWVVGWDF